MVSTLSRRQIHRFGAHNSRAATVMYDNARFYCHGIPDGIR